MRNPTAQRITPFAPGGNRKQLAIFGAFTAAVAAGLGVLVPVAPMGAAGLLALLAGLAGIAWLKRVWVRPISWRIPGIVVLPLFLIFISIIRVELRDARGAGLGKQAIFEFGLQGIAAVIVLAACLSQKIQFRLSPVSVAWIGVAGLAATSALWAPSTELALMKGLQLAALSLMLPVLGWNSVSRQDLTHFLTRAAAGVLIASAAVQAVTSGPNSLLETDGQGRQRLSLLALHPLILAGLCGALALLLLSQNPGWVDWLLVSAFTATTLWTGSRVPALALLGCMLVNLAIRGLTNPRVTRPLLIGICGLGAGLLGIALLLLNNPHTSLTVWVVNQIPTDASSLNGRLPLWHATWADVMGTAARLHTQLFGHGFASFRYFGLDLFAYAGEAHNAELQVLYELGIVGLALWSGALLLAMSAVVRPVPSMRGRAFIALFCLYLLVIELTDSSLADSRGFLLILLLPYAHAPVGGSASETRCPDSNHDTQDVRRDDVATQRVVTAALSQGKS